MKRQTTIYCALIGLLLCSAFTLRPDTTIKANDAAEPSVEKFTTVPLHRFYQSDGKDHFHFYTANQDEMTALKKQSGWKYEGIIGNVFPVTAHPPSTVPLYRLAKVEFGEANHFYTTNQKESNEAINNGGWASEGICCYIAPTQLPGTVPLIHLYKDCEQPDDGKFLTPCQDAIGGDSHFYTTNGVEKFSVIDKAGYQFIRNEGYVWQQPTTLGGQVKQGMDSDSVLLSLGCTRNAVNEYDCETQRSFETCQSYKQQNIVKTCTTKVNPLVQASIDKELFSLGCKRFLGRADEFYCKTQNGLDLCEAYRKNGKVKKCMMEKIK